MSDIAQLGLSIDSSSTTAATAALDKFAVAGAAAGDAADALAASGKSAGDAVKVLQTAGAPAAAATEALASASKHAAGAHAGMSTQAMSAAHSIRSMGESLALGVPLSQALTQQLNHLSYAASGPGGLTGAFKEVGGLLGGFLTPLRVVGVAVAGLAAGAYYLATSWSESQHKIALSLQGIGKASGATVDDINSIALASASSGKLSVTAASEIASALAQTGKISKSLFGDAIAVTRDYAKVMGVDTTKAADMLAKALVDPVTGADQLNQRLGFLDFSTQNLIKSLVTQNNITAAQKIILDGVKASTGGAAESASGLSKAWESVTTRISGGASVLGQMLGGSESDQSKFASALDKVKTIQASIASLQSNKSLQGSPLFSSAMDGLVDRLHKAQDEADKFGNKLATAADQMLKVKTNAESLQLGPVFSSLVPEVATKKNLADVNTAVQGVGGDSSMLKALGLTPDQVTLAKGRAKEIGDSYLTTVESAGRASDIQMKAIDAKSPSQRADIAYQQTMLSLAGQNLSLSEKQGMASKAAAVASAQASYALTTAAEDRLRAAKDTVGATQVEIISIGKTTGEVALLKANWQAYTTLRAEAAHNNTAFDQAQYDSLTKINGQYAAQVQLLEKARIAESIRSDRATAFLTPEDAAIYQQLKGSIPDVTDALNSADAAQIRFNNGLRAISDTGQSVNRSMFVDFETNLRSGKNAWDSFKAAGSNALGTIAGKLASMTADNLWKNAFGGSSGGGLLASLFGGGGIAGAVGPTSVGGAPLFAAAGGGTFGPGWGVVGEKGPELIKVHNGGVTVIPNHISKPYLPGFADGGSMHASGNVTRLPGMGQNNGHTHVTVGVSVDNDGNLQAYVKDVSQKSAADGVNAAFQHPSFVDHIAKGYQTARTQRKV